MLDMGSGTEARVAEQIQSLGSNLIMVRPGSVVASGVRLGAGTQLRITEDDAEAIQSELDAVEAASAFRDRTVQIVYGALNWATRVNGVAAEYLRSEEHTSELQSRFDLVCRLLLEKKKSRIDSCGLACCNV